MGIRSMKSIKQFKQFRARLDPDLIEDLSSNEVLSHYDVENPSQLARKVFRKAVDEAKSGKDRDQKKVEFRVG